MSIDETKTKTATKSKNPVPNRERIKMPRQHMPEQLPVLRAQQFTEVNLGYSEELARQEAIRCLECAKPTCTHDCPVGVNVKEFVQLIVEGDFLGAAAKIRESEYSSISDGLVTGHAQMASGRHSSEPRCDISAKAKPPFP